MCAGLETRTPTPKERSKIMVEVDPYWWQTLFDEVYLVTDARSVCNQELTCREADFILEVLPIEPGHRVLDLCGGHGRHSLELSRRGFKDVTVLDYSSCLVEKGKHEAAQEGLEVCFLQGDARSTGLGSGRFDAVMVLGNSFGYFTEEDHDRQLIGEARRLLDQGGFFVIDLVDGDYLRSNFKPLSWHEIEDDIVVCREREMVDSKVLVREVVMSKSEGLVRDRTYSARLYTKDRLVGLLDAAGFSDIEVHTGYSSHNTPGDYGFMTNRMVAIGRK